MLQDYQIQEIAEKYVEEAKNFSSYAWHYISEERAIDLLSGAISDGLEAFALTSEVSELKRKLADSEGVLYKALENIANQGHAFDGATNADLAKRALALYEDRAKQFA